MDFGEHLFRKFLRIKTSLNEKEKIQLAERETTLNEMRERLFAITAMLSGKRFEIVGGSGTELVSQGVFLFPDSISDLPTKESNNSIFLYRLLFLLEATELGIKIPQSATKLQYSLATLMVAKKLGMSICERYPGAKEIQRLVYKGVLHQRPSVHKITSAHDILEVALQKLLSFSHNSDKDSSPLGQKFAEQILEAGDLKALYAFEKKLVSAFLGKGTFDDPKIFALPSNTPAHLSAGMRDLPDPKELQAPKHITQLERTIHIKEAKKSKANIPIFHSFEKTESIEDYQGESAPPESNDDLENDTEALNDLSFNTVIRSTERPSGLVKAEIYADVPGISVQQDLGARNGIAYPEWDHKQQEYRSNWCFVFANRESELKNMLEAQLWIKERVRKNKATIDDVRRQVLRIFHENVQHNRQLEGPEFDIDALVDWHAALTAKVSPPERLYLSPRPKISDTSILVLFDTSLSSDGWIEGRRVLDTETDCLVILCKAFTGILDDQVAVAHFNSKTRLSCRFSMLKDFSDPWDRLLKTCPAVQPDGYTRIGPAIRHGTQLLKKQKSKKKILLLISDAKPTDYDQYEGKYGVNDTAQAVREARQFQIHTSCLTIENRAKNELAQMFGRNGFKILNHPSQLPKYAADVFLNSLQ